jgi:hypothetical protein
MKGRGTAALVAALICFVVFFGNVASGAAGAGVYLGDVSEMLALLVSAVLFVIGVLMREASARNGGE